MAGELTAGIDWTGMMGVAGTVLMWVFIILVLLGLFFLVWYFMSFKNVLVVRQIVSGRKQIRTMKWKVVKDKNGVRWLITPFHKLFGGFKRSLPSHKAIDLGKKGRYHVEAWYDAEGDNLIWINDDFSMENYLEEYSVKEGEGTKLSVDIASSFQPIATADRELIVSEMIRAEQYRSKNKLQAILQIALFMVPIILVIVIAMTIGEVTEALTKYTGPMSDAANRLADSLEKASMHLNQAQEFTDNTGGAPN